MSSFLEIEDPKTKLLSSSSGSNRDSHVALIAVLCVGLVVGFGAARWSSVRRFGITSSAHQHSLQEARLDAEDATKTPSLGLPVKVPSSHLELSVQQNEIVGLDTYTGFAAIHDLSDGDVIRIKSRYGGYIKDVGNSQSIAVNAFYSSEYFVWAVESAGADHFRFKNVKTNRYLVGGDGQTEVLTSAVFYSASIWFSAHPGLTKDPSENFNFYQPFTMLKNFQSNKCMGVATGLSQSETIELLTIYCNAANGGFIFEKLGPVSCDCPPPPPPCSTVTIPPQSSTTSSGGMFV